MGDVEDADCSNAQAKVVFDRRNIEKSFTFTATQDTVHDDNERDSISLVFLPTRLVNISAVSIPNTTVTIRDDDPLVSVRFAQTTYLVNESVDISTTDTEENEKASTITAAHNIADDDGESVRLTLSMGLGRTDGGGHHQRGGDQRQGRRPPCRVGGIRGMVRDMRPLAEIPSAGSSFPR